MKERIVYFAAAAQGDLIALHDWIAATGSPATALAYIQRLEVFCRSFSHAAERGSAREDIRPGLRILGFERRVTVVFSVTEVDVTILRLFYGGRNWQEELS